MGSPYLKLLTVYRLINSEYEYIALHRDVGETELKQGREIRSGGNLVYVDSPAVRAAKCGTEHRWLPTSKLSERLY